MDLEQFLTGRALLLEEIPKELHPSLDQFLLLNKVHLQKGFLVDTKNLSCVRCGAAGPKDRYPTPCVCGESCFYCIWCLQMGRIKKCSMLYWLPEPEEIRRSFSSQENSTQEKLLAWEGKLSKQQQIASEEIVQAVKNKRTHLVWAVAGAGKTEMLFEGIQEALLRGERVCVASPRVDVCLELAPRLKKTFPLVPQSVLYGTMEGPYERTPLVIATTHQLLRFTESFDVLIIDEVDAFPYHNDPTLAFGASKAKKKSATLIYLTATPDERLQKRIATKQLTASILPARYHQHPLPVPVNRWAGDWKEKTLKRPKKSVPIRVMKTWLEQKRRFLIFVPNIQWMHQFEKVCQNVFSEVPFAAVSSVDPFRKEKVSAMRKEEYQFLITTTILERGVTFPNIHVIVLGAEDRTFTEAALVQIAGRAGRSPLFPSGEVLFMHQGKTKAMKKAIKQIKTMNHLARKKGYIRS